jgi:hypothetical protein
MRTGRGSGGLHESLREQVSAIANGGAHETEALSGRPVEAALLDLPDEAMGAEFGELAADMSAALAPLGLGARRGGIEQALEVTVAKASDRVISVEHGAEQVAVMGRDGIEASVAGAAE